MEFQTYVIRMKIYLLTNIAAEDIRTEVTEFIDSGLMAKESLAKLHQQNQYKYYCFDAPYPLEKDKIYKKDQIYTLTIRTIDYHLANYFSKELPNTYTGKLKGLTAEARILPRKHIDVIYTLTPAILKCESGYWKDEMNVEQYEERLRINLIKKWNAFHGEKLEEDFEFSKGIEFLNNSPIGCKYKGIKLLGDKIQLHIEDNRQAQELAYFALGTGVLEINARGFGYVNYRWL